MVNRSMRNLPPLLTKKVEIKSRGRNLSPSIRMSTLKLPKDSKSDEDVKKGEFLHTAGRNVNW